MSVVWVEVEGWPGGEVPAGSTLLEACEHLGVPMESACGGFAACSSCRVRVREPSALSALDEGELPFLDRADQRLGCQARVIGDVRVALEPGM